MTTRSKYVLGQLRFYDDTTYETMGEMMPIQYRQDFIGSGAQVIPAAGSAVDGWDWVKKLVLTAGSPTVAGVANAAGGQAAATIDATSEKQEATLYHGDSLAFDVTKGLVFECRVQLKTLPSVAAVEAVWGLQSAWIDGPDNATYYAGFGATGSGVVNMRTQDGVTQNKRMHPARAAGS